MPKSKERFEEIKQERKRAIVKSAIRTFCRNGYDNTKIDDISRDCGCSHGLIYHYFQNKDEVFRYILTRASKRLEELYGRLTAGKPFTKDQFVLAVQKFLQAVTEENDFVYILHFLFSLPLIRHDVKDAVILPEPYRNLHGPHEILETIFSMGQREGWIRADESPGALATLFESMVQGLSAQKVFSMDSPKPFFCTPRAETLLELFLAVPEPEDPPSAPT